MEFSFDVSKIKKPEYPLIPEGRYNLLIERGELKETKNGHLMISFRFQIVDGEQMGRILFDNLLVGHPNCADFAQRKLGQICGAVGVNYFKDISELDNKVFSAQINHYLDKFTSEKKERICEIREFSGENSKPKSMSFNEIMGKISTDKTTINQPKKVTHDDVPF